MNGHQYDRGSRHLHRDSEQAWVFGVCAGLADSIGMPIWLVRLGAAALLFLLTWWHIVLAYLLLAAFLSDKPLRYCGRGDERSFWSRGTRRHGVYRR